MLLRPALLSASPEVAVWGMRVFAEMAGDLLKTFIHAASHEFLLEGGRGLEALVLCHKRQAIPNGNGPVKAEILQFHGHHIPVRTAVGKELLSGGRRRAGRGRKS